MSAAEIGMLRLQDAWRQACRHVHHMLHALRAVQSVLPLDAGRYTALDDEQVQDFDQFILRFSKLQDVIDAQLYPALLEFLQEPYSTRPMLDKLHRLEQLGYLGSVEDWQVLREVRNRFTHDYPDDAERNAASLNVATSAAVDLHACLARVGQQLAVDQPGLSLEPLEAF